MRTLTRSDLILGFLLHFAPEAPGCTLCGYGIRETGAGRNISKRLWFEFLGRYRAITCSYRSRVRVGTLLGKETNHEPENFKPLIRAGMLLGVGMGGSFDEALFHQILQVHSMMTGRIPKDMIVNAEINMFWNGLFPAFTWSVTMIGLVLLWRAVPKHQVPLTTKCSAGSMILGAGLFNSVEGVIDHHILRLHHVVERLGVSVYDYAFFASGVVMIVIGLSMVRADKKDEALLVAERVAPSHV